MKNAVEKHAEQAAVKKAGTVDRQVEHDSGGVNPGAADTVAAATKPTKQSKQKKPCTPVTRPKAPVNPAPTCVTVPGQDGGPPATVCGTAAPPQGKQ
jgi:hypothetical protein